MNDDDGTLARRVIAIERLAANLQRDRAAEKAMQEEDDDFWSAIAAAERADLGRRVPPRA